jgi:hypothetical protein
MKRRVTFALLMLACAHGCATNAYLISLEGKDAGPMSERVMALLQEEVHRAGFDECGPLGHDATERLVSDCTNKRQDDPGRGLEIVVSWKYVAVGERGPGWMVEIFDHSSSSNSVRIHEMRALAARFERILRDELGSGSVRIVQDRPYFYYGM